MKFVDAIAEARKNGLSTMTANRLKTLAIQFASPEAMLASPKGILMSTWRKISPESTALGARFWRDFEIVRVLVATPDPEPVCENPTADPMDGELTLQELKSVVDIMEISQMGSVSIREIISLLGTVRRHRKEPTMKAGNS